MKAFDQFRETVLAFLDQGKEHVMLLVCKDEDIPIAVKIVEQIDQSTTTDVCISFVNAFDHDAELYVETVLGNLSIQIEGLNVLREDPWPPVPYLSLPPFERLSAGLDHINAFMPEGDHRILWSFLPVRFPSQPTSMSYFEWARVVGYLLGTPKPGQRFIVRATEMIVESVRQNPELLSAFVYHVDFSPEAAVSELVQEVQDPSTLPKQQAMDLFQLAGLDFSHRRYVEAVKKYGAVYSFFENELGCENIKAMCLIGVGDVARFVNDNKLARQRYQQALALVAGKPDFLFITMIACSQLGDLGGDDAMEYYELASSIAGKLCNLEFKCDVMEKIGDLRDIAGDPRGAEEIWRNALALCHEGEYKERAKSLMRRLSE